MDKCYEAPEVKVVGEFEDAILGSIGFGTDIWGEMLPFAMEFAEDPADPDSDPA